MTVLQLEADVALAAGATLGEGPRWDARDGRLLWVDILAGRLHRFDPATGDDAVLELGAMVGCVAPRASGGWVAGVADTFAAISSEGDVTTLARVDDGRDNLRMNDGRCDPAGRFLAGTMDLDEEQGAGSLWSLGPDLVARRVFEGVTISNGIDWSPAGTRLYYIDSPTRRIDACAYDPGTGALGPRGELATIPAPAFPDGLCVDAEGCVWVALWDGGAVRRYAPDGRLLAEVRLPCSHVSACGFGGPDLTTLYVTTARKDLAPRGAGGGAARAATSSRWSPA